MTNITYPMAGMTKTEKLEWLEKQHSKLVAEAHVSRLLCAKLVTVLEFALTIIGHPDDAGSKFIASVIAQAKGYK